MYQLQFINLVYDTTKLTHLEQTNINLFIGNWSNHQLQKSICIRHGDDTSHNQYHILFIDTAHQRIKFSSFDAGWREFNFSPARFFIVIIFNIYSFSINFSQTNLSL